MQSEKIPDPQEATRRAINLDAALLLLARIPERDRQVLIRSYGDGETAAYIEREMGLDKGQVREMGSHQELLAKRGIYYKLYQLQYKDQALKV